MIPSLVVRLPWELFQPIIQNIADTRDLCTFARVSRYLQKEAETVLYRRLTLHAVDTPQLCSTLSTSTRVSALVRECILHISPEPENGWNSLLDGWEHLERSRALINALSRMTQLQTLYLHGGLSGMGFMKLIKGCSFTLRSFCTSCPIDDRMVSFLETQHDIEEFEAPISVSVADDVLLPSSLPKVRVVRAISPEIAAAIVPHRPVTHLKVYTWCGFDVERFAMALRLSAGPVRSFMVVQGFRISPDDLCILAKFAPTLQFLGECTLTHDINEYVAALRFLPQLQTLMLNYRPSSEANMHLTVLPTLRAACPSLSCVILSMAATPVKVWRYHARNGWNFENSSMPVGLCHELWRKA